MLTECRTIFENRYRLSGHRFLVPVAEIPANDAAAVGFKIGNRADV